MLRTVEEIEAHMQKPRDFTDICELTAEFVLAVTADLHNDLDRLAEICAAEKNGRCVVLPCNECDGADSDGKCYRDECIWASIAQQKQREAALREKGEGEK